MQKGFVVSVTGGPLGGKKKLGTKSVISKLNADFKPVSTVSEHPSTSSINTAVLRAVGESLSSLAKQLGNLDTVLVLTPLSDLEGRAAQLKKQEAKNPSIPVVGQQDATAKIKQVKRALREAKYALNALEKETPKAERERDIEALKARMTKHRTHADGDLAYVAYYLDLLNKKTNIEDPKKREKLLGKIIGRISESSSSVLEGYLDMVDELSSLEGKLERRNALPEIIETAQKELKELSKNTTPQKPESAAELKLAAERIFLDGIAKAEHTGCSIIFSHAAKLPFELTLEEQKTLSPNVRMGEREKALSNDSKAIARRQRQSEAEARARRAKFRQDRALAPLRRLIKIAESELDHPQNTKPEAPVHIEIPRQKIDIYVASAAYSETKVAGIERRREGTLVKEINSAEDGLSQNEQEQVLKIFNDIRNQHDTPQAALLAATTAVKNATVVEQETKIRNVLQEQQQHDDVAGFAWRVEYENRPAETGSDLCSRSGETQTLVVCLSNCLEMVDIPEHSEVTIYTRNTEFLDMMSHLKQTGKFPEPVDRGDKRDLKDLDYFLSQISVKCEWVLHGNQSMNLVQQEAQKQAVSAKRTSRHRTAPAESPAAALC